MQFILDGVDIPDEREKKFPLTVVEEPPLIETEEDSIQHIPHPPCSDEYIYIEVHIFYFENVKLLESLACINQLKNL